MNGQKYKNEGKECGIRGKCKQGICALQEDAKGEAQGLGPDGKPASGSQPLNCPGSPGCNLVPSSQNPYNPNNQLIPQQGSGLNVGGAFGDKPTGGTDPYDTEPKDQSILDRLKAWWNSPAPVIPPEYSGAHGYETPEDVSASLQPAKEFGPVPGAAEYKPAYNFNNPGGTFGEPTQSSRQSEEQGMQAYREMGNTLGESIRQAEEKSMEALRQYALAGEKWARDAWQKAFGLQPLATTNEEFIANLANGGAVDNALQNRLQ